MMSSSSGVIINSWLTNSNKVFFAEPIALILLQANVYDEQAADQEMSW